MSNGNGTKDMAQMPWWFNVVQRVGLPTALVVFMCYGAWRGVSWFGANIAMPMYVEQVKFINSVDNSVKEMAKAAQLGEESRALMSRQLENQTELLEQIKTELKTQ